MADQEIKVLKYMTTHPVGITQAEAMYILGISRLSARIYNLKKEGYTITDTYETGKNRDGKKIKWKRYRLNK